MSQEDLSATLRVRVPRGVKKRLEGLATKRHTDISELVRQALFSKYPDLADIALESSVLENDGSSGATSLAEELRGHTAAIRKLIDALTPKPKSPEHAAAAENLRRIEAAVPNPKGQPAAKKRLH